MKTTRDRASRPTGSGTGMREKWNENRRKAEAVFMVLEVAGEVVDAEDEVQQREAITRLRAALDRADKAGVVCHRKGRPS